MPTDIREKGRVDILLWWANDTPRAIIEIKNQIYTKAQYEKDIHVKRTTNFGRYFNEIVLLYGLQSDNIRQF